MDYSRFHTYILSAHVKFRHRSVQELAPRDREAAAAILGQAGTGKGEKRPAVQVCESYAVRAGSLGPPTYRLCFPHLRSFTSVSLAFWPVLSSRMSVDVVLFAVRHVFFLVRLSVRLPMWLRCAQALEPQWHMGVHVRVDCVG